MIDSKSSSKHNKGIEERIGRRNRGQTKVLKSGFGKGVFFAQLTIFLMSELVMMMMMLMLMFSDFSEQQLWRYRLSVRIRYLHAWLVHSAVRPFVRLFSSVVAFFAIVEVAAPREVASSRSFCYS